MTLEFIPPRKGEGKGAGHFTAWPDEIKKKRAEAKAQGKDEDAAEKAYLDEIKKANDRLKSS